MILIKYNRVFKTVKPWQSLFQYVKYKSSSAEAGKKLEQRFAFELSKDVEEGLLQNKFKARKHPGIMNVKCVNLPPMVMEAIEKVKEQAEYPTAKLTKDAQKLSLYIWQRQTQYEDDELRETLDEIAAKLVNKGKLPPNFSETTDRTIAELTEGETRILKKGLKQRVYNWKAIDFTKYKAFVYLWARLSPDYAALVRIFQEIRKRRENFQPRSLFDFGSGVGSVTWAVDAIWPETCQEMYNVDCSGPMNFLAELLFLGGDPDGIAPPRMKNTYYRQFLPSSDNLKYDLVVSSRTFFELENLNTRARTVDILWKKVAPGGFLVLVEAGTKFGYSVLLEMRDYLLEICKVEREKYSLNSPIHVFSPCPHDKFCPRFNHRSKTPCHFTVTYQPLNSSKAENDLFSYIVLQKEERKVEENWPRIVQPVLIRSRHTITRTCTPDGSIREVVATKAKHGTVCCQLLRNCAWGDLLPVRLHNDTADQTTTTTTDDDHDHDHDLTSECQNSSDDGSDSEEEVNSSPLPDEEKSINHNVSQT